MEYLGLFIVGVTATLVLWQYRLNQKNIILVFDASDPSDLELAAREQTRLELALAATTTFEDQTATFKALLRAHSRLLALASGQSTDKVAASEPELDIRQYNLSVADFADCDPSVILPGDDVDEIDDEDDEPILH